MNGGADIFVGSNEILYSVHDLIFSYRIGTREIPALRGASFELKSPCFVCIRGPSGSGKTTLLHLLGLVERVQRGSLRFMGVELSSIDSAAADRFRRYHVGFAFQDYHLLDTLTAEENVEYFLARQKLGRDSRKEIVRSSLEHVGMWSWRTHRPLQLSAGQRQRLAIARAVAKRPTVILADEPTAALDQENGKQIIELLKTLHNELNLSVIISSHDPMVQEIVEDSMVLSDGRIVQPNTRAAG